MSLIDSPDGIDAGWLSTVLGAPVGAVAARRVGSGQIGACYRLEVEAGDGVPARLIAKLPAEDEGQRAFLSPAYRTEVRFYREIARTVAVRAPRCHYSAVSEDGTSFVLLLEDAAPAEQGDQLAGCDAERAEAAIRNLAGLHGPRWCDPELLELGWLGTVGEEDARTLAEVFAPAVETFIERFGDALAVEDRATLRDVAAHIADWVLARPDRFGLVHGDYRLDNLLFAPPDADGPEVTAVDWQTLSLGHPLRDVAFFLGTSLVPRARAEEERRIVTAYHDALVGYGVTGYTFDDCFEDYRFAALQGPLITVLGCAYGTRTERGDAMFLTMAARSCAMIRDLGSFDLI